MSDVCLSVHGPKSRIELVGGRLAVASLGKRQQAAALWQLAGAGAYCGGLPHSLFDNVTILLPQVMLSNL